MECGVCGCPLDGVEIPSYLYSCGDLVCCQHVLSPYCYRHSDALLTGEMSVDPGIKRLKEIKDWLEKQNSGNSLNSAISGIKTDMGNYLAWVARQGGIGLSTDSGYCSATQEYTYWVCTQCSNQNTQESMNCWKCQTYRNVQISQVAIWTCPWCNSGHYAEETSCQCGYPTQTEEKQPNEEEKKPKTTNMEVQVQFQASSIGIMTDFHCDRCKSTIPCQFLCEQCALPRCIHCSKAIGPTERMCEGCRDSFKPIRCEKCGEKAVQTYCEDCFIGQNPEIANKETNTGPFICVKCNKSPANEVICTRCIEPEPLTCSNCHEITSKDHFTCEKCSTLALLTCNRCQSTLPSSHILCSKCISPTKVLTVDIFRPPDKSERPVKALPISSLAEERKLSPQNLALDKGTPQKTGPKTPVHGDRVPKQEILPAGSYQSRGIRPLSAVPVASGQRGIVQLRDPVKTQLPSKSYTTLQSSSTQPVPPKPYSDRRIVDLLGLSPSPSSIRRKWQ